VLWVFSMVSSCSCRCTSARYTPLRASSSSGHSERSGQISSLVKIIITFLYMIMPEKTDLVVPYPLYCHFRLGKAVLEVLTVCPRLDHVALGHD
jgi:hypothetical protein